MQHKKGDNLYDKILYRASLRKRDIGITIDTDGDPKELYQEAMEYANVIPTRDISALVGLLREGKVQGIVRGRSRANYLLFDELQKHYKFTTTYRCSIIRDVCGRYFFFGPTGLTEGNDFQNRLKYIERVIKHMRHFGLMDPRIALLSLTHIDHSTYVENKENKVSNADRTIARMAIKSYEESEKLSKHLSDLGYKIKNYENNIEKALKDGVDFIVPSNGLIGNAISRALWLVDHRTTNDKARLISLQLLTDYTDWVCEDTSSSEDDFSTHIIAATAWLNKDLIKEKS